MIEPLDRLELHAAGVGRTGSDLLALRAAGVPIADTIACTTDAFWAFRPSGRLGPSEVDRLSALLAAPGFAAHPRCAVRVSTARPYQGLAADAVVESNPTAVKHALERVYRSWSSDRARAARLSRKIGERDGAPAVLVQPEYPEPDVLLSRVPTTGAPTAPENVGDAAQNTLRALRPEHVELLERAERAVRRPVRLRLAAPPPRVLAVDECPLVATAELSVAADFFRRGWIDPIGYLTWVEPRHYMESGGMTVSPPPEHEVQGLGVSPGIGLGRLLFPGDEPAAGVLAIKECSPEDVAQIVAASAVISQCGGKSGHCATACRAFGKPAVVLDTVSIRAGERRLVLPDGAVVSEGAFALVDGATGRAYFSDREFTIGAGARAADGTRDGTDALLAALAAVEDETAFKALPEDAQFRIGLHRRYLRELGLR